MLTREWMGVLALGILWVNTLLVVGAALQRAVALSRLRRAIAANLRRGAAPSAGFASTTIEQLGRYGAGSKRTIVWHDRAYTSELGGGEILVGEGESLEVPRAAQAMVWLPEATLEEAAAARTEQTFDEAYAGARKAKGFARKVSAAVPAGTDVFVAKVRTDAGDTWLVSEIDPLAWCRARAGVIAAAFVPAVLAVASGITVLALWPPAFGVVSIVGASLGVLYFLLVLPAGTAVRDWARLPHERIVRGVWTDPAGRSTPAANEARGGGKPAAAGAAVLLAAALSTSARADVVPAPYGPPGPYGAPVAPLGYAAPRPVQKTRFRGAIGGAVGAFVAPETRYKYYQFISLVEAQAGWQFNDLVSMYAMGRFGFGGGEEADAYGGISWMSELTFENRLFFGFGFDALFVANLDETNNRTGFTPGARFRMGGYPLMFGTGSSGPRRRGLAVGAELGFHPFINQLMLAPTVFVSYEVF